MYNKNNILSEILKSVSFLFFSLLRSLTAKKCTDRENVIVISLHHIGDTVFTIPAIKNLKRIYKDKITIVCYEHSRVIYELTFSDINYLIIPKPFGFFASRIPSFNLRKQIKSLHAKSIFDITGTIFTSLLVAGQNAEQIVGSPEVYFRGAYSLVSLRRIQPHRTDMYIDMISMPVNPVIDYQDKVYPVSLLKNESVLIFPFGGWEAKGWNLSNFVNLAKLLSETRKCSLITQKNQKNSDVKKLLQEMNIPLIETNSLTELVEHIKGCFMFVSNDTGPLYIASLLGKPTFTIYGPTNPEFSIPFGKHHKYIRKALPCSPTGDMQYCFTNGGRDGCSNFECMRLLTLEEVSESLIYFINELEDEKCS